MVIKRQSLRDIITLICKLFQLCCSSSPSNCIDDICLKANSWYWQGKDGEQIVLTADHLEFMGQMNVDGQSNCIWLKDTDYFDIGCKQPKQSICEVEGMCFKYSVGCLKGSLIKITKTLLSVHMHTM